MAAIANIKGRWFAVHSLTGKKLVGNPRSGFGDRSSARKIADKACKKVMGVGAACSIKVYESLKGALNVRVESPTALKRNARVLYLTDSFAVRWDGDLLQLKWDGDKVNTYRATSIKQVIAKLENEGFEEISGLLKEGFIYIHGEIKAL